MEDFGQIRESRSRFSGLLVLCLIISSSARIPTHHRPSSYSLKVDRARKSALHRLSSSSFPPHLDHHPNPPLSSDPIIPSNLHLKALQNERRTLVHVQYHGCAGVPVPLELPSCTCVGLFAKSCKPGGLLCFFISIVRR